MGTDLFLANETEPRGAASQTLVGKQVLFDGAKRNRDPYVGDMAVASLTSYLSHNFAEPSLNVLEDLAKHQRSDGWIPPASMLVSFTWMIEERNLNPTNDAFRTETGTLCRSLTILSGGPFAAWTWSCTLETPPLRKRTGIR